jgi:uncharacterized repeat protein (TIGR01451 family)
MFESRRASVAPDEQQRILSRLDPDRRQFLQKILLTAYAAPFVASFGLKGLGLGEAMAQSNLCSNVAVPNTSADLIIAKTGFPNPVAPGGNITYSIRVQNCGPSSATNVSVNDPIPAGTTFVSASQTSGPTFTLATPPVGGTGNFVATTPTFTTGSVATFQLIVQVTP